MYGPDIVDLGLHKHRLCNTQSTATRSGDLQALPSQQATQLPAFGPREPLVRGWKG